MRHKHDSEIKKNSTLNWKRVEKKKNGIVNVARPSKNKPISAMFSNSQVQGPFIFFNLTRTCLDKKIYKSEIFQSLAMLNNKNSEGAVDIIYCIPSESLSAKLIRTE